MASALRRGRMGGDRESQPCTWLAGSWPPHPDLASLGHPAPTGGEDSRSFFLPLEGKVASALRRGRMGGDPDASNPHQSWVPGLPHPDLTSLGHPALTGGEDEPVFLPSPRGEGGARRFAEDGWGETQMPAIHDQSWVLGLPHPASSFVGGTPPSWRGRRTRPHLGADNLNSVHGRGRRVFFLPLEGKVASALRRGRMGGDQMPAIHDQIVGSGLPHPDLLLRRSHPALTGGEETASGWEELFFLPLEGKVASALRRGRMGGDPDASNPRSILGSRPPPPRPLLRRRHPSLMEGKKNQTTPRTGQL